MICAKINPRRIATSLLGQARLLSRLCETGTKACGRLLRPTCGSRGVISYRETEVAAWGVAAWGVIVLAKISARIATAADGRARRHSIAGTMVCTLHGIPAVNFRT